ncbi:MAG: hypothetical protein FJX47_07470 [Alphaproteobacteria bacterium]|nr:hypothetical protein [Alphaproteobacteria bacterium]
MRLILTLLPWLGLGLAVPAALLQGAAGTGWRNDWWTLLTAFDLIRWSAYGAFPALAVAVVGLIVAGARRQGVMAIIAGAGALIAAGVLYVPLDLNTRRALPPINDITTDWTDPPAFAVYPVGATGQRDPAYPGESFATRQRQAYPDLHPVVVGNRPGAGAVGHLPRKFDFEVAPVVLGLILSPMIETSLRQSLGMSDGSYAIFFTRPLSLTMLAIAALILDASALGPVLGRWRVTTTR